VTDLAPEQKGLLKEAWGALNFILAFYEPGQTHLDTEAWKRAEASGRRTHQKLSEALGIELKKPYVPPAEANQPPEVEELQQQIAAFKRFTLPLFMSLAEREIAGDPVPDDAILFSFMGSGASDQTTVAHFKKALRITQFYTEPSTEEVAKWIEDAKSARSIPEDQQDQDIPS